MTVIAIDAVSARLRRCASCGWLELYDADGPAVPRERCLACGMHALATVGTTSLPLEGSPL